VPSVLTARLVQLLVGILLIIALLNAQRDLFVLSLLVLGLTGGAWLWGRLSQLGLRCDSQIQKQKVFPNEKIVLTVLAENAKLLPIWMEINIPIGNLLSPSAGTAELTKLTSLLWFQRTLFKWELSAPRRGVYNLGPLEVWTGDLFSFFPRRMRTARSHTVTVYPRLVPLKSFSLPQRDFFGAPRAMSPVQDPIYILGTRDYQHGRPSRHIHWKASARHRRLQEKIFEPTVQEKVLLAVNVNSFAQSGAEDNFERTLEVVASLAVRLDQHGHSVGLISDGALNGDGQASVSVARDDRQAAVILDVLARLEMKSQKELRPLLQDRLSSSWGISCVYFTFGEDPALLAVSEYFAVRHTPVVFCVNRRQAPGRGTKTAIAHPVYSIDDICMGVARL
jgi:uncharacterized protein (DUF58 family)